MAYKVFQNGFPLPASDLNTFLMNQSVMVFADSTARSAALTAPTEGMLTYLESDNSLYLYTGSSWVIQNPITTQGDLIVGGASGVPGRLGIGTNGQILTSNGTTATWATPASGSMTLLSTTSLTGSAIALTSISGDYRNLRLVLTNPRPANNGANIQLAVNSAGASANRLLKTTFGNETEQAFVDNMAITRGMSNVSGATQALVIVDFFEYAQTTTWKSIMAYALTPGETTQTSAAHKISGGQFNISSAISEINLNYSSGNFAAGTAYLYGVR